MFIDHSNAPTKTLIMSLEISTQKDYQEIQEQQQQQQQQQLVEEDMDLQHDTPHWLVTDSFMNAVVSFVDLMEEGEEDASKGMMFLLTLVMLCRNIC